MLPYVCLMNILLLEWKTECLRYLRRIVFSISRNIKSIHNIEICTETVSDSKNLNNETITHCHDHIS